MTPRAPIDSKQIGFLRASIRFLLMLANLVGVPNSFLTTALLHFNDLFRRYGAPIILLNLIKRKKSVKRESKLLDEYTQHIDYLNQSLPKGKKTIYHAYDVTRAYKE